MVSKRLGVEAEVRVGAPLPNWKGGRRASLDGGCTGADVALKVFGRSKGGL